MFSSFIFPTKSNSHHFDPCCPDAHVIRFCVRYCSWLSRLWTVDEASLALFTSPLPQNPHRFEHCDSFPTFWVLSHGKCLHMHLSSTMSSIIRIIINPCSSLLICSGLVPFFFGFTDAGAGNVALSKKRKGSKIVIVDSHLSDQFLGWLWVDLPTITWWLPFLYSVLCHVCNSASQGGQENLITALGW